jgi:hypothetical protein
MIPELWYFLRFAITTVVFGPIYAYFRGYSLREAIQLIFFILVFSGFVALVTYLVIKSKKIPRD